MTNRPDSTPALRRGLSGYLRAVAAAVAVPKEGTSYEISDTATAYVALHRRLSARPDQDLMLVWSENTGWVLAVETDPTQEVAVVAYLGGDDAVPDPASVAEFVTEAIGGTRAVRSRPEFDHRDRHGLADRLSGYGI
jgi:hypothetical protein